MRKSIFDKPYQSNVLVLSMFEQAPWQPDVELVTTSTMPKGASGIHAPEFSPFLIGPVKAEDGLEFQTVENLWQYSKVYLADVLTGVNDQRHQFAGPNEAWFNWREEGAAQTRSKKVRPYGKDVAPLYHFYDGLRLSKVAARKLIYCPAYVDAIFSTPQFAALRRAYKADKRIVLRCWDGYSIWGKYTTLFDVINDPDKKFGHAFVLAMMLEHGPSFSRGLLL